MELFNYDGRIDTFSGLKFSFLTPEIGHISIIDIGKGLANKGHFGGQTEHFFSIAQHSLLVLNLMTLDFKNNYKMGMAALLHDASEAYTGDMVKPLKELLPEFKRIEDNITRVIFEKFSLPLEILKKIKPYDLKAQEIEYDTFFNKRNHLEYLSPNEAYKEFITQYLYYKNLI